MPLSFKKDRKGSYHVIYNCPDCQDSLRSPTNDIGGNDSCPKCGCNFHVPGEKEYVHLLKTIAAKEEEQQLLKDEARRDEIKFQAEKEQKRQENERIRKQEEEEIESRRLEYEKAQLLEQQARDKQIQDTLNNPDKMGFLRQTALLRLHWFIYKWFLISSAFSGFLLILLNIQRGVGVAEAATALFVVIGVPLFIWFCVDYMVLSDIIKLCLTYQAPEKKTDPDS